MVCLGEVIDNTIDVGFDVLWTADVKVLICCNMKRVRDTEVIPEEFMEGRVFVNPYNLVNRYHGNAVIGSLNKKVFRDKHILGGELWQCRKFFFCLLKQLPWLSKQGKVLTARRENRTENPEDIKNKACQCVATRQEDNRKQEKICDRIVVRLAHVKGSGLAADAVLCPGKVRGKMRKQFAITCGIVTELTVDGNGLYIRQSLLAGGRREKHDETAPILYRVVVVTGCVPEFRLRVAGKF